MKKSEAEAFANFEVYIHGEDGKPKPYAYATAIEWPVP